MALLLFPGVQSLDVSGPMDVFAEANAFLPAERHYRLVAIGTVPSPIRASNGQQLVADLTLHDAGTDYDIVLVAGGPELSQQAEDPQLSQWLRAVAGNVPRYGSICTGAYLLGRAGLLDGKRATTHWSDAARLAAEFPLAQVEHDRIHVRDGGMVTSAGVTAGIDLALALVSEDHGAAVAWQRPSACWCWCSAKAANRNSAPICRRPAHRTHWPP